MVDFFHQGEIAVSSIQRLRIRGAKFWWKPIGMRAVGAVWDSYFWGIFFEPVDWFPALTKWILYDLPTINPRFWQPPDLRWWFNGHVSYRISPQEDSLSSCRGLMPKPPRRDEQKLLVDADKVWVPCLLHFYAVYNAIGIYTSIYI